MMNSVSKMMDIVSGERVLWEPRGGAQPAEEHALGQREGTDRRLHTQSSPQESSPQEIPTIIFTTVAGDGSERLRVGAAGAAGWAGGPGDRQQ